MKLPLPGRAPSRSRRLSLFVVVLLLLAGCSSTSGASAEASAVVAVSAPVSTAPWIATSIQGGAQLAAADVNRAGGVVLDGQRRQLRVHVMDNAGSPSRATDNARTAVSEHAAILLIDGVGAPAVASITDPAHLPVFLCFDGGDDLIDPAAMPTLFRMAPQNTPMARRLADYVANAHPKVAILADDSGYGRQGGAALRDAFRRDDVAVVDTATVPAAAADLSTQVLAARRAGATRLVVWASAPDVAAVVSAARSAGWSVPIDTGTTGEDPLVRQRLAAHPQWLRNVRFVSFRITAEVGPAPFAAFRRHYEAVYGPTRTGLTQQGRPVIQPPDWPMLSYDAVRLAAAAMNVAHSTGAPLLAALNGHVSIVGANGDERGYLASQHEGVNPTDMYFARFVGFTFRPVSDDPLSGDLPAVNQLG